VRAGRALTKKRITTRATALFSGVTFESPLAALTARRLTPDDVAQAVALTADAGWNQIDADWRMMLDLGDGVGFFDGGKLVATAIILPYDAPIAGNPKFAWISMVLVTKAWQRKGIARWLLERCIATLQGAGYMPMLDATPAGREVYRKLGFVEGAEIQRLERTGLPGLNLGSAGGHVFMPLSKDRVADAADYDSTNFGAARAALIEKIRSRFLPAYLAEIDGRIDGYMLLREGQRAFHLGPIAADSAAIAADMLMPFGMYIGNKPVFVDVFSYQATFVDALIAKGFVLQRKLTRMHLGPRAPDVARERYFAIAGPELG
jgi:GNAT superfamily N-acetyltransferase